MRLTKLPHSCVRLEHDGTSVVIDPGLFATPEVVEGVDGILLTHEHPDHVDVDNLRATDAPIWTIESVAEQLRADAPEVAERVTVVEPDSEFRVGRIPVQAVGEWHAVIHPEFERVHNSGYVLSVGGAEVYHPGDALTPPPAPVDVLLLPVCAPWMRAAEAIDFARHVEAPENVAIHDRVYSDFGLGVVENHLDHFLTKEGLGYTRLADGDEL